MLLLCDVLVGVELLLFPFSRILVFEQVFVQQFGQCFPVDAECERFEVHRPDMCCLDRTDVGVLLVLLHLQHCFGLVAKLRSDVSPCVLVPLVLMQYGVYVYVSFPRPCHQQGDYLRGLAGAVDVVHHIPYSVNDYQPYIFGAVNGLPHDCYSFLGRVLP